MSTGDEQRPRGDNAERARLQSGAIGLITEVAQMAVDQIRLDEEPTALNRSGYRLKDVGRPGAAVQPSLRRGIAKVEVHPDKIPIAHRDVGLSEIAQRLPQPAAECEGEQRTTVTHASARINRLYSATSAARIVVSRRSTRSAIAAFSLSPRRILPDRGADNRGEGSCSRQTRRAAKSMRGSMTM